MKKTTTQKAQTKRKARRLSGREQVASVVSQLFGVSVAEVIREIPR